MGKVFEGFIAKSEVTLTIYLKTLRANLKATGPSSTGTNISMVNLYFSNLQCFSDDSNCNELKTEVTKSQHILVIPKTDKNVRKSKKITLENNINDINKHSDQTKEVFMDLKQESTNKKTVEANDSYEVTENPETIYISKAEPSQNHHGYIYKPPKQDSNVTKSNPTETLSKILSKYNLNSKDELQNYAISRVSSAQNTLKSNLPDVPFKVSSFNYLPVNPLLAVLLSNYGYYLPGAFGIRNNYRNLYGYLASNNIHNNKPFGSYKIYSDTDSYNK